MIRTIEEFDEVRALAMRGLLRAQELKTAYLYGRGFGLDMPEYVAEDMLIEGLWLFDYLHSMDATSMSLICYASADEHPNLEQELAVFRAYLSEAARKTVDYYDRASKALKEAVTRINAETSGKTGLELQTIPARPWTDDPAIEASGGDGFNLGWEWPIMQDESTRLGRHLKQHGYAQDHVLALGARNGIEFIRPHDQNLFDWIDVERKEGEYDWSRIDRLLTLCKKHGMALWMAVPSYNTSPPEWLRERLKNRAVLTGRNGKPLTVRTRGFTRYTGMNDIREWNNPVNLFDPDVSKAFTRYLRALIAHVRDSGVKIVAAELGSSRPLPICFGPETEARWQAWLKRNNVDPRKRWNMGISASEAVLPGKLSRTRTSDPRANQMLMDIDRWREDEYVEYFRVQADAIRAVAPDVPICMQSCDSGESNESMNGRPNERLVRELGLAAFSYGGAASVWDDLRRSYSPTHWSATRAYSHWWDTPAQYSFSSYIHGAFTIMGQVTPLARGFYTGNTYWYPDLRLRTSTLRGWRRFQERAQGMAPEMLNTKPAPQAAVMWSDVTNKYQSSIHDYVGWSDTTANYHKAGCIGWDRILNSVGIAHDFVTEDQVRRGDLRGYQMLIMPAVQAMSADVAQKIREYVQNGGKVVATSAPALFDPKMQQKGTGQLADVFGADFDRFLGRSVVAETPMYTPLANQTLFRYWTSPDINRLQARSDSLKTLYCTFKPRDGAKVLEKFTTGEPAVILNDLGEGKAVVIGYPIGRESYISNAYREAMGQTVAAQPNGSIFQQGLFRWFEHLLPKMPAPHTASGGRQKPAELLDLVRDVVVNGERVPRPVGQDAGWPCWQWTRKGGGYRDYVWKRGRSQGGSVAMRSVEAALRRREGNPNTYLTVFNREGGSGFDPGLTHFESTSKEIAVEFARGDIKQIYDLSLGCPVSFKRTRKRGTLTGYATSFRTMIEPSMARMFVIATQDDTVRLYAGNRVRGRNDDVIREAVAKLVTDEPVPQHVLIGPRDVALFLSVRGLQGVTISAESPVYLPAAERLAAALEKAYGKKARITRNSPRIEGGHWDVSAWRTERHTSIEEPDILLGSHNESHYIAALRMHGQPGHAGHRESHTARWPIMTSHTFPGPGRSATTLLRPFRKRAAIGNEAKGRATLESPAPQTLIIGASGEEGLNAGVDNLIRLILGPKER